MGMKPLTAEDLVVGGKYVIKWLGDNYIVTYDGCRENEYNFVSEKKNFYMHEKDIHHLAPYHEPNQTPMEYTEQPFNLETALKHPEWVRTRDGREIDFIKEYPESGAKYSLTVVLKDGSHISYTLKGEYQIGDVNSNDLALRVPYQTVYVSILPNGIAFWNTSDSGVESQLHCVPVKIPAV